MQEQAGGTGQHDQDFGVFDDPDDARLVMGVRQLAGERGQQEEWRDEQSAGDGAERRFLFRVPIDAVDDQHHHRRAEQIVVERAQELRDEDRQEAPCSKKVCAVLHRPAPTLIAPLATLARVTFLGLSNRSALA